jgi:PAS domain S-box-containing protein
MHDMTKHDEIVRQLGERLESLDAECRRLSAELSAERDLFRKLPDLVFILSSDGFFESLNAAWGDVLGYPEQELLSAQLTSIVHPDDRQKTRTLIERVMTGGGKAFGLINRCLAQDGSSRWIEWNFSSCGAGRLSAVARDMTARVDSESKTRLSADAFRYCTHGIAIGIPSEKRILFCNPAFATMHGMSIDEVSGTPVLDLYPETEHQRIRQFINECQQKNAVSFESLRIRKDGSAFPVQMDLVHVLDEEDRPFYHIATVQDITQRKLIESALRESEGGFRSVVESAPEAILIHTGGRIAYVNPAALKLYGADDAQELTGRDILDLIHPDYHERVRRRIRLVTEQGRSEGMMELKHVRMDGKEITVEIVSVPFTYGGSKGSMLFVRDITERRKAEEERKTLEMQLFQAQKMESIGRLAGGVAHDLNNLLTPILGYTEMLTEQFPENDRRLCQIRVVHHAGQRARDLVRQLTAFSRRQSLAFRGLDLNAVVRGFEQLLRRTLHENISVSYALYDGVLSMQGDIGQIEQILMNLSVNAQDAMPDGGELLITTAVQSGGEWPAEPAEADHSGKSVVLVVSDSGSGMSAETSAHIFEPFFTTKELGRGTGLGLSTVYGIVRQHGGAIYVCSEPGRGTTFRICFPYSDAIPCQEPCEEAARIQDGILKGSILVVEDNEMVRVFVVHVLRELGYAVHDASSGEEALRLLEKDGFRPDLLLTDVVMQGMSGKELFDHLKERDGRVRVLYMSGYTQNIITDNGVLREGTVLLQKPFSMQMLASKVEELLCR